VTLTFTHVDYFALGLFILCWVGYTWVCDYTRWSRKSLTAVMNTYRVDWMMKMLYRDDPRIVDTNIEASLLNGIAFFASTTMIVMGGLIAMLGATDQAIRVLADIPFAIKHSRGTWELKVLLLITIFVYAFFKFAWSFRLLKYSVILIGATPLRSEIDAEAEDFVRRIADLISLEAVHFNQGLRSYLFALAALGWFIHPYLLIAATAWVTVVLYRRDFRSRSLRCFRRPSQTR
jgi:uncharacterized membrane protein